MWSRWKVRFIKLFVKVIGVIDKVKYPNYKELKDVGFIVIDSIDGGFVFMVKEDQFLKKEYDHNFLIPRRYYTVELVSSESDIPNEKLFSDKVMLTVKVNLFSMSKRTLINLLVDMYLDKMLIKLKRNKELKEL